MFLKCIAEFLDIAMGLFEFLISGLIRGRNVESGNFNTQRFHQDKNSRFLSTTICRVFLSAMSMDSELVWYDTIPYFRAYYLHLRRPLSIPSLSTPRCGRPFFCNLLPIIKGLETAVVHARGFPKTTTTSIVRRRQP
jgi:hypothetical protein